MASSWSKARRLTYEVEKTRVFHTQAKYVQQEKSSFHAAVGFKPTYYEIAVARIEQVLSATPVVARAGKRPTTISPL